MYTLNYSFDAKVIILKGTMNTIFINHISILNMIFIDISFCETHTLKTDNTNKNILKTNIFLANFSNNNFINDLMITFNIFKHIIILDFSSNFPAFLTNNSFFNLQYLSILRIDNNPITFINLISFIKLDSLLALSIRYVYFSKNNIREDAFETECFFFKL